MITRLCLTKVIKDPRYDQKPRHYNKDIKLVIDRDQ